nr:hypothetical protein [Tanacetum cinerariifolium]
MFVVKAATNKIGATRAHNLLCSMKGGYEYVYGTTDDFKNHQRDVNVFIGESDALMLINKMENRKMYLPNFTFQYRVENSELVAMFWADEVAKCNYKESRDTVSFDATFNSNKTTLRSESENSFFKSFTSPEATLVSFMMSYESAMKRQMYRQEALDFKTIEAAPKCETKLATELHAARVYTRTIFLLVQTEINKAIHFEALDNEHNTPDLRRQRNRYGKKLTIERLRNEANFLVDDSLFLLSKNERKMGTYVEKLKILLDEMKADMPNPPSRNTGDVIDGIFSITKPNQIAVQNQTKAMNKGEL